MKVAGYEVSPTVYCAYGISDDNKVLRGKDDSVFYAGGYEFSSIDSETTYLDLKAKLDRLYSNGIEEFGDGKTGSERGMIYQGFTLTRCGAQWRL